MFLNVNFARNVWSRKERMYGTIFILFVSTKKWTIGCFKRDIREARDRFFVNCAMYLMLLSVAVSLVQSCDSKWSRAGNKRCHLIIVWASIDTRMKCFARRWNCIFVRVMENYLYDSLNDSRLQWRLIAAWYSKRIQKASGMFPLI